MRHLFLALALSRAVLAQAPPIDELFFERVWDEDLPSAAVTDIVQDRDGFLWLGTEAGLLRFDGYRFVRIHGQRDDPTSMAVDFVRSLWVDEENRIWVGTMTNGLAVLDPTRVRFEWFRHDPDDPDSLSHDRVEALASDRRGGLWIGTNDGLDHLDLATGRITPRRETRGLSGALVDDHIRSLLAASDGTLWVGSWKGLDRLRPGDRSFEPVASGPAELLHQRNVYCLLEDEAGRVWIGTVQEGLAVWDPATDAVHQVPPPDVAGRRWITALTLGSTDSIWAATTTGGIDIYDLESRAHRRHLGHDLALPSSIGSDRVGSLFTSRAGLVWVGTWGDGLHRHNPNGGAFRIFAHRAGDERSLSQADVRSVMQTAEGPIWVGTVNHGIEVLDLDLGVIDRFPPEPGVPGALADGTVTCLTQLSDGSLWVGTLAGLHEFDPTRHAFTRYTTEQGLPTDVISVVAEDPIGRLWVGTGGGLTRLGPNGRFEVFRHDPQAPETISDDSVTALATAFGVLWVGTERGLNALEPSTASVHRILRSDTTDEAQLSSDRIVALQTDRKGQLWVLTDQGVDLLTSWDGSRGEIVSIDRRLGISLDHCGSLVEQLGGAFWCGHDTRIDTDQWHYQRFDRASGVDLGTQWLGSVDRGSDGRLLFGGSRGLLVVDPSRLRAWSYRPPVVVTELLVEGRLRPTTGIPGLVQLGPRERSFSVEFAALDFSSPRRNRYEYRLVGFDEGWHLSSADRRIASYTNLPPGRYELQLRGSNRLGQWSDPPLVVPILIEPSLWQTWWFRTCLLAAILALALLVYRVLLGRHTARQRELARLVRRRTADLEHRTEELAAVNAELRTAYAQIERASVTDPLTGLWNRRYVFQTLPEDVALALRRTRQDPTHADASLLLFAIDLDDFKSVNDEHGHGVGDQVLVQFADLLRALHRASDVVVRWGGEEFLVVARFLDAGAAAVLAEKLRSAVAAHPFDAGQGITIRRTCSIGYSAYPFSAAAPEAIEWQRVLDIADLALYAAKNTSRNAWVGIEPGPVAPDEGFVERLQTDPEAARRRGEIVVRTSIGRPEGLVWR